MTAFNEAMQTYVLRGSLVRVKVWTADGTIVYSDEPRLIGQTFPLGDEETEALENGQTDSEISDLTRPENIYEQSVRQAARGLQRRDRRRTAQQLLFEAYFRYDAVVTAGQAEWRHVRPRRASARCCCSSWSRSRSRGHWPAGCSASSWIGNGCCSTRSTPPMPNDGGSPATCTTAWCRT